MNKISLTILTILVFNCFTYGQEVLKKKEVLSKLELISIAISQVNFEKSLEIFYNKSEVISIKNVPKKQLEKYKKTSKLLSDKKEIFDQNKKQVKMYEDSFRKKEFCNATGLLSMELTNENSYNESRNIQTELRYSLEVAKTKCGNNSNQIVNWNRFYDNSEFEKVYHILELSKTEKSYFIETDFKALQTLQQKLKDKNKLYSNAKEEIVEIPNNTIRNIDYDILSYDQSLKLISNLTTYINTSELVFQQLEGKNSDLYNEYELTKTDVAETLSELMTFSEKNKPLSNKEVSLKVFGGKPITINFIENKCKEGNADIYNIYDLDVIYYYGLQGEYNTDLKKEVYKESIEYRQQLTKLKKLRTELFNTTYYVKEEGLFDEKENAYKKLYNIKKKGFDLNINDNLDYSVGTRPPKSVSISSYSSVLLKRLPSRQVVVLRHEIETYRRYCYLLFF